MNASLSSLRFLVLNYCKFLVPEGYWQFRRGVSSKRSKYWQISVKLNWNFSDWFVGNKEKTLQGGNGLFWSKIIIFYSWLINKIKLQFLIKLTECILFQRRKKMEEVGWQYVCSHALTKHLPHSIWGPPGIWVFYQTEQLQLFWEILNLPRRTSCHVLYWKTCEK